MNLKTFRNRILEILRTVPLDNKSCIDSSTSDTIVIIVLTRIYNKIFNKNISEQEFKELRKDI